MTKFLGVSVSLWLISPAKLENYHEATLRLRGPRNLPALLRRQRTPPRPLVVPRTGQRSHAALHQRRHEPVQRRLSWPREARLLASHHFAKVRPRRRQA